MQRTVKATRITFATVERDDECKYVVNEGITEIPEANAERAVKKFKKCYPEATIIATEEVSHLYYLDDEIFFKYAVIVDTDND